MFERTKGTRRVKLCVTDDQYTETGHPLTRTRYDYDQDGMITFATREYSYSESATRTMGEPIMRVTVDQYRITKSEELLRKNGTWVTFPHVLLYEEDPSGIIRRVVEAVGGSVDEPYFPIHYYIGSHPSWPRNRGLVTRERHLFQDGTFAYEYQYEYNEHGHKTQTYTVGGPGMPKQLTTNQIFEYDERGNITWGHVTRRNKGQGEYAYKNKYDKEGNLCAAVVTKRNQETGKWELVGRHEYSYEEFEITIPPKNSPE